MRLDTISSTHRMWVLVATNPQATGAGAGAGAEDIVSEARWVSIAGYKQRATTIHCWV